MLLLMRTDSLVGSRPVPRTAPWALPLSGRIVPLEVEIRCTGGAPRSCAQALSDYRIG